MKPEKLYDPEDPFLTYRAPRLAVHSGGPSKEMSQTILSGRPLDVIAEVWSNRRSGWLKVGNRQAPICSGGVLGEQGMELIDLALQTGDNPSPRAWIMGDVSFTAEEQSGLSDHLSVGLAVWRAAVRDGNAAYVDQRLSQVLRITERTALTRQLPLGAPTVRLLEARPRTRSLGEQLEQLTIQSFDVGAEIHALVRLGLIGVQRACARRVQVVPDKRGPAAAVAAARPRDARAAARRANARPKMTIDAKPSGGARQVKPTTRAPTRSVSGADDEVANMLLMRRLKREVEALSGADDWTVLGVARNSSPDRVSAAGRRMRGRYGALVDDLSRSTEIRHLAKQICERVDVAIKRLDKLRDGDPIEEEAFRRGRVALGAGRAAEAVRYLTRARDRNLNSARNLAWLGWALHQDPASSDDDALEMLQLAEQFNSAKLSDPVILRARFDLDRGRYGAAEDRLARLLRKYPDLVEARQLFVKARQMRARQG